MKKNKIIPLDIAEYLDNEEIVAEYLDLACQSEIQPFCSALLVT
jgi:DNA-binding phage protein